MKPSFELTSQQRYDIVTKDACLATTTICLTTPLSRLQNYTPKRKSLSPPSKSMLTNGWLKTPKREPHKKNINQNFCR